MNIFNKELIKSPILLLADEPNCKNLQL